MLGAIRRSIGRKLLLALGLPTFAVCFAGVLWLRSSTHRVAPGLEPVYRVALVGVVVLAAAMAITHLLVVKVLLERPLGRLGAGMRRAREGDFLHRVPVESDDELGQLARSYNDTLAAITDLHVRRIEDAASMASMERELALKRELEQRVQELTLLSDLAKTLSATLELDEVLRALAARVGRALGGPPLQVLLADDATGELVVRAVDGMDDAALGERHPPATARPGWSSVRMHTGDDQVGELAVRRPIEDGEVRLLEAIAAQAAMAVANARLHGKMVRLSQTDALTGVHNRRSLFARVETELERSARFEHACAIALVDVDHFKRYNEALGHAAGDAVLREVGRLLAAAVRKVDLVARYGGEEFAIVLARADRAAALTAGEKLRAAVEEAAIPHAAGVGGRVTISVGVAVFPEDARDTGGLIDCADAALYASKRGGRNLVSAHAAGMRTHPGRKRDVTVTSDADVPAGVDEQAAG
jgi:diguanylate cyclase (GGDEF)-like protein